MSEKQKILSELLAKDKSELVDYMRGKVHFNQAVQINNFSWRCWEKNSDWIFLICLSYIEEKNVTGVSIYSSENEIFSDKVVWNFTLTGRESISSLFETMDWEVDEILNWEY